MGPQIELLVKYNKLFICGHKVQRGLVFLFFGNHIRFLPSYLADDFTVFFFLSGFLAKKKNRQPKLTSIPKFEKILTCLGKNHDFLLHGFFFSCQIPREKKNRKIFSFLPIFSADRQFCM